MKGKTTSPPVTRHNVRAVGKTHTTISLSESVLDKARQAAQADDRSLSKWIERLIAERVAEHAAAQQTTMAMLAEPVTSYQTKPRPSDKPAQSATKSRER